MGKVIMKDLAPMSELEKIGILKSKKIGKETLFLNVALLKLLES